MLLRTAAMVMGVSEFSPARCGRHIRAGVRSRHSLLQPGDTETGLPLAEMLADTRSPQPEEAMFTDAENKMIRRLLERIDRREAKILRMRFGLDDMEPMTLKDIGEKVGLTRERVRQIENEALRRLNQLITEEHDK